MTVYSKTLTNTATLLSALILALITSTIAVAQTAPARQISLNGSGEVHAKPDRAELMLSVEAMRATSAEAKSIVDDRVNLYLKKLAELGIQKTSVVAATLQTHPQFDYQNNTRRFTGYQAVRNLTVSVEKLDQLDAVMQAALDSQIDGIGQIRYLSSKEDLLRAQARELAIQDSKEKAQLLAKAYDAQLGPISSIQYFNQSVAPVMYEAQADMMMLKASAPRASQGEYLADDLVFTDSINVVFDLLIGP